MRKAGKASLDPRLYGSIRLAIDFRLGMGVLVTGLREAAFQKQNFFNLPVKWRGLHNTPRGRWLARVIVNSVGLLSQQLQLEDELIV